MVPAISLIVCPPALVFSMTRELVPLFFPSIFTYLTPLSSINPLGP